MLNLYNFYSEIIPSFLLENKVFTWTIHQDLEVPVGLLSEQTGDPFQDPPFPHTNWRVLGKVQARMGLVYSK